MSGVAVRVDVRRDAKLAIAGFGKTSTRASSTNSAIIAATAAAAKYFSCRERDVVVLAFPDNTPVPQGWEYFYAEMSEAFVTKCARLILRKSKVENPKSKKRLARKRGRS